VRGFTEENVSIAVISVSEGVNLSENLTRSQADLGQGYTPASLYPYISEHDDTLFLVGDFRGYEDYRLIFNHDPYNLYLITQKEITPGINSPYYVSAGDYTIVKLHKDIEVSYDPDNPGHSVRLYDPAHNIPGLFESQLEIAELTSNDIIVSAWDDANNPTVEFIYDIKVDNEAPIVELVLPKRDEYVTSDENMSIVIDITDLPLGFSSGIDPSGITMTIDGFEISQENYSLSGLTTKTLTYEHPEPWHTLADHVIELIVEDRAKNRVDHTFTFEINMDVPKKLNVSMDHLIFIEGEDCMTPESRCSYFMNEIPVPTIDLKFIETGTIIDSGARIANITINGNFVELSTDLATIEDGHYQLQNVNDDLTAYGEVEFKVYAWTLLDSVEDEYSPVVEFEFIGVLDSNRPEVYDIIFEQANEHDNLFYTNKNPINYRVQFFEQYPDKLIANESTHPVGYEYVISEYQDFTPVLNFPNGDVFALDGEKNLSVRIRDYVGKISDNRNESIILDTIVPIVNVDNVRSAIDGRDTLVVPGGYRTGAQTVTLTVSYNDINMDIITMQESGQLITSDEPLFISDIGTDGGVPGMSSTIVTPGVSISVYTETDKGVVGTRLGLINVDGEFEDIEDAINYGNARLYIYNTLSTPVVMHKQILTINSDEGIYPIYLEEITLEPNKALSLYIAVDGSTYYSYRNIFGNGPPDLNITEAMTYDYLFATPNLDLDNIDFDEVIEVNSPVGTVEMNASLVPNDNLLIVYGWDKAGNYESIELNIDFDYSPPNITIISPEATTDPYPTIVAQTDEYSSCRFTPLPDLEIDFDMESEDGFIHLFEYPDFISLTDNVVYEFLISCEDEIGNVGEVLGTFVIDITPPELNFTVEYENVYDMDIGANYYQIRERYQGYILAKPTINDESESIDKDIMCTYECIGQYCHLSFGLDDPYNGVYGNQTYQPYQVEQMLYPYINDEWDYLIRCYDKAGNVGEELLTIGNVLPVQYKVVSSIEDQTMPQSEFLLNVTANLATAGCEIRQMEPTLWPVPEIMDGRDTKFNYYLSGLGDGDYLYEIDCDPFNQYEYDSYLYELEFSVDTGFVINSNTFIPKSEYITLVGPDFKITNDVTPILNFMTNGSVTNCTNLEYYGGDGISHSTQDINQDGNNLSVEILFPLKENARTELQITCNVSGEYVELVDYIDIDTISPSTITLTSESGFNYETQGNKYKIVRGNGTHSSTRFIVEADEEVFCRYDNNLSHQDYEDMDYDFE
jgi:hypothetical protein